MENESTRGWPWREWLAGAVWTLGCLAAIVLLGAIVACLSSPGGWR